MSHPNDGTDVTIFVIIVLILTYERLGVNRYVFLFKNDKNGTHKITVNDAHYDLLKMLLILRMVRGKRK